MAGTGTGRGAAGRGIFGPARLQAASLEEPSSGTAQPRPPGTGRGSSLSPRTLSARSEIPPGSFGSSQLRQEERARGDFDQNRGSTYRMPKKFRNHAITSGKVEVKDKWGSDGAPVKLTTNYFAMQKPSALYNVAYYWVSFTPVVENKREREALITKADCLKDVGYWYDGKASLFMAGSFSGGESNSDIVTRGSRPSVRVDLKFKEFIGDPKSSALNLNLGHGVVNDLLARTLKKLGLTQMGDGFFNDKAKAEIMGLTRLNYRMYIWPGYKPLVMHYDGGLLMNVDLCCKFVRSGTVLDAMKNLIKSPVGSDEFCREATELLGGTLVLTTYSNTVYKVKTVTNRKSPLAKFYWKRGQMIEDTYECKTSSEEVTIQEYIKKLYNTEIKYPTQPILMCEKLDQTNEPRLAKGVEREPIPIVPELCWLSGLTDDLRTNLGNMNKILDAARKEPGKRGELLKKFAMDFNSDSDARNALREWALTLGTDLEEVQGRELKLVTLAQVQKPLTYDRKEADWTRNLRGSRLDDPKEARKIFIVHSDQQVVMAQKLYETLQNVGRPMGMNFSKPEYIGVRNSDPRAFKEAMEQIPSDSDMALCLLPDNKKDRYDAIKVLTAADLGIPSQCILAKNADPTQRSMMSIVTKVALQMNAKMGGPLWHIRDPAIKIDNVVVIGVVIGHISNLRKEKIAAFVATDGPAYNRFHNEIIKISSRSIRTDEYRQALGAILGNRPGKPLTVIIYRQMEREDEMDEVTDPVNGELKAIRDALSQLPSVKLLFCLAVKRCSTRFFSSAMTNPNAGTLVNTKITVPGRKDFFLISHNGRKGTVMPTYYFIVYDDSGIPINDIHNFTFQMSHMYYNWSGTIKVPAVCQYAFKLATMYGEVIKKSPNKKLESKLWFL